MLITGSHEWIGGNAQIFLDIRSKLEKVLILKDFQFFYGGCVSKESVYNKYGDLLGDSFKDVFINFKHCNEAYIFSPEYTFRVHEYMERNNLYNEINKVFYSQEMMRNETVKDIKKGKTFNFWQIGYEIFGENDLQVGKESISTIINCLDELSEIDYIIRITDKKILESICHSFKVENIKEVYRALETSNEDGKDFYSIYTKKGGNKGFASVMKYLLNLSEKGELSLDVLKEYMREGIGIKALEDLECIYKQIKLENNGIKIIVIPAMAKSWDAYTTLLFDARIIDYDKAIAGGGNLNINRNNPRSVHSGAGIGVSRICEYLISKPKL